MQPDAQSRPGNSCVNSSRTNIVNQANPDSTAGPPENHRAAEQTSLRKHSVVETDPAQIPLPPSRPEPPVDIDNPSEIQPENGSQKEPDANKSWDVIMKRVEKYDEEMIGGWIEDINTLLVFAGLLSAVVTAFTIESYRWLREDPADVTVALLTQISQQLIQQNSSSPTTQHQSFQPASLTIRINCYWFLSLILSLATSLFALLCKQWLHENQREVPMPKPEHSLALRQMRYDSLKKGRVPMIVGMLPVLVEISLLSFFYGLLGLFDLLKVVPLSIVGYVLIGLSMILYLLTSFIPGVTLGYVLRRDMWSRAHGSEHLQTYRLFWPYKSPQAWLYLRIIIPIIPRLFPATGKAQILRRMMPDLRTWSTNWPGIDNLLIMLWQPAREDMNVYLWEGVKFALRRFDRIPSLQPHLLTILRSVSPEIALPMGMPQYYRAYTWINSDNFTIGSFFDVDTNPIYIKLGIPLSSTSQPRPDRKFILRIITNNLKLDASPKPFDKFIEESSRISQENVPKRTRINFTLFFHIAERIWKENRGVGLFDIYRNEWGTYSNFVARNPESISLTGDERYQLIASFAKYINTRLDPPPAPPPVVLTDKGLPPPPPPPPPDVLLKKEGLDFLDFIHKEIIEHKLYDMERHQRIVHFDVGPISNIIANWVKAMEVIRQKGELGEDYFAQFPPSEARASSNTQNPKTTVEKFIELRDGISSFIRNALTRRAESTPDSQA